MTANSKGINWRKVWSDFGDWFDFGGGNASWDDQKVQIYMLVGDRGLDWKEIWRKVEDSDACYRDWPDQKRAISRIINAAKPL